MQIIKIVADTSQPICNVTLEHDGVTFEILLDSCEPIRWAWLGQNDWTVSLAHAEKLGMTEAELLALIDQSVKDHLNKDNQNDQ